ncbi:hypothetical protein N9J16_00645 [Candidatus Poseidoniaceae archaeon]|nr:hypothetical protein [Candidatus Poseidoniaceae archaeon]
MAIAISCIGLAGKHVATLTPHPNFSRDIYGIPPFYSGTSGIFIEFSTVDRRGGWAGQEFRITFIAKMDTIDISNPNFTVPMASFWGINLD